MINIPRGQIGTQINVNQVGHFKELIAGAGAKVLKVNREGLFIGRTSFTDAKNNTFAIGYDGILYTKGIVATNGTFRGTIYAEAGAIEGDLIVSGSLYSDTGGYRTKMFNGRLSFLYNNTQKAYIMASDNGTGIQISSTQNIYLTMGNGVPIVTIGQSGDMQFASDTAYIRWAGGRKMSVGGSNIVLDGNILPVSDINATYGNIGASSNRWKNVYTQYVVVSDLIECQGSQGQSYSGYGFITSVRINSDRLQAKYRTITTKGGIVTNIGDESNWVTMENDGSMNG